MKNKTIGDTIRNKIVTASVYVLMATTALSAFGKTPKSKSTPLSENKMEILGNNIDTVKFNNIIALEKKIAQQKDVKSEQVDVNKKAQELRTWFSTNEWINRLPQGIQDEMQTRVYNNRSSLDILTQELTAIKAEIEPLKSQYQSAPAVSNNFRKYVTDRFTQFRILGGNSTTAISSAISQDETTLNNIMATLTPADKADLNQYRLDMEELKRQQEQAKIDEAKRAEFLKTPEGQEISKINQEIDLSNSRIQDLRTQQKQISDMLCQYTPATWIDVLPNERKKNLTDAIDRYHQNGNTTEIISYLSGFLDTPQTKGTVADNKYRAEVVIDVLPEVFAEVATREFIEKGTYNYYTSAKADVESRVLSQKQNKQFQDVSVDFSTKGNAIASLTQKAEYLKQEMNDIPLYMQGLSKEYDEYKTATPFEKFLSFETRDEYNARRSILNFEFEQSQKHVNQDVRTAFLNRYQNDLKEFNTWENELKAEAKKVQPEILDQVQWDYTCATMELGHIKSTQYPKVIEVLDMVSKDASYSPEKYKKYEQLLNQTAEEYANSQPSSGRTGYVSTSSAGSNAYSDFQQNKNGYSSMESVSKRQGEFPNKQHWSNYSKYKYAYDMSHSGIPDNQNAKHKSSGTYYQSSWWDPNVNGPHSYWRNTHIATQTYHYSADTYYNGKISSSGANVQLNDHKHGKLGDRHINADAGVNVHRSGDGYITIDWGWGYDFSFRKR